MRIFLDGAFYGWSGIGRVFSWLVSEMALRNDVEKVFCALASSSVPAFEQEFAGIRERIRIVHLKGSRFSVGGMFGYAVDLSSLSHQIDVIHFLHTNIPLRFSSFGVPVVVTVHDLRPFTRYAGISPLKSYLYRSLITHSIRRADAIATDSETIRQDVLRRFRPRPSQTTVAIPPGMSLRVPPASTSESLPVQGRYILFVGDIRPHKNLETLLRAFQEVRKRRSDLTLVVVGRPHAAGRLVLSAMKSGEGSSGVTFLGRVDDETLGRLYAKADLLILPSLYEGYGIPLAEIARQTGVSTSAISKVVAAE